MFNNLDAMRKHYAYDKEAFEKALHILYPALQVEGNSSLSFKAAKTQMRLTEFGQSAISLDFDGSFSLADLVFTKVGPSVDAQLAFYASLGAYVPNTELVVKAAKPKPKPEPKKKLLLFPKPLDGQSLDYITKKTGSNPETLARLGVFGNGHFGAKGKVSLMYQNGTYTKVKTVTDGQKSFIIDGKKAVFFGSDLLPAFAETLYVCEGEDDAICLIALGFAAISVGSSQDAKTDFSAKLLGELKGRFDAVFSVFDADDAGRQAAKHLQDLGLCAPLDLQKVKPFLCYEIGDETNGLLIETLAKKGMDICDLFGLFKGLGIDAKGAFQRLFDYLAFIGPKVLEKKKDAAKPTFSTLELPSTILGPSKIDVIEFGVNRYVSEAKTEILNALDYVDRAVLWALAGSGKTRLFQDIVAKYKDTYERIIIFLPTIALAGQTANEFKSNGQSVGTFFGGTRLKEDEHKKIVIASYDMGNGFAGLDLSNSLVIVDEFHMLISEETYREKAVFDALECAKKSKKNILVSATPNWVFFAPLLNWGYKLLRVTVKETQKIDLTFCEYIGKRVAKADLFNVVDKYIHKAKSEDLGAVLVFFDNTKMLDIAANNYEKRGLKTLVLKSKGKEDNADFAKLIDESIISKDIDLILTTRLLEAGVSIKSKVASILYFGDNTGCLAHYNKVIQLATRPRMDNQKRVNSSFEVVYFYSEKEAKPKAQLPANYETVLASRLSTSIRFEDFTKQNEDVKYKTASDLSFFAVCSYEDKRAFSSVAKVLYSLYRQEFKALSVDVLSQNIEFLDKRFNIKHDIELLDKCEDVRALAEVEKQEREKLEGLASTKFIENPNMFLHATLHKSKAKGLDKEAQKASIGLALVSSEELKEYISENANIFTTKVPRKLLRSALILANTEPDFEAITEKVKHALVSVQNYAQVELEASRTIFKKRKAEKVDKGQTKAANAVRERVRLAQKNSKTGFVSAEKLASYLNKLGVGERGKELTSRSVIKYLEGIISQAEKERITQNDKRIWVYKFDLSQ